MAFIICNLILNLIYIFDYLCFLGFGVSFSSSLYLFSFLDICSLCSSVVYTRLNYNFADTAMDNSHVNRRGLVVRLSTEIIKWVSGFMIFSLFLVC